ncbi:pathogenesis-related protein PRB1-2-like [Typha latifolia]|uniref:pathogenesis-related protein PRB1-2-like n=1 Tax=Typha latifolia TaxID=4733 RepID=UPI003C2C610E
MGYSSTRAFALICAMAVAMVQTTLAQNTPQDFVRAHNSARAVDRVGPVTWDATVAAFAQDYANQRRGDCRLIHSGGRYGENIFMGSGKAWSAADAVNLWVSEKKDYNYAANTCAAGKVCGHYTQVVWRTSVRIGCARVVCNNGGIFITCNYDPPGNINGGRPFDEDTWSII